MSQRPQSPARIRRIYRQRPPWEIKVSWASWSWRFLGAFGVRTLSHSPGPEWREPSWTTLDLAGTVIAAESGRWRQVLAWYSYCWPWIHLIQCGPPRYLLASFPMASRPCRACNERLNTGPTSHLSNSQASMVQGQPEPSAASAALQSGRTPSTAHHTRAAAAHPPPTTRRTFPPLPIRLSSSSLLLHRQSHGSSF